MAGDWLKMDHDLPDKPEVLGIVELTGLSIEKVVFLLFLLWRLADRQTEDGILRGVGPRALVARIGGTAEFWEAVAKVGWIRFSDGNAIVPKFSEVFGASAKRRMSEAKRKQCGYDAEKKRRNSPQPCGENNGHHAESQADPESESESESKSESPQEPEDETRRDDHLSASFQERVRARANELVKIVNVKPSNRMNDRSLLLKVCTLLESGRISEHAYYDAVEAIKRTRPNNRAAEFHFCLDEHLRGNGGLNRLLATTEIPEGLL
jgi:hypothetical protein